jgi:serine/threonine protein kinase
MGEVPSDKAAEGPSQGGQSSGWVQGFTPLPTGTRVGELVVQSVLGAGEFGITYLTEHEKRSKRYALKEYFPRAIAYRDGPTVRARTAHASVYTWGLERFLSEARAQQKVKHPALVSLLGVTELGGTGYVGMAYEQGREFGIWLHEQKRIAPQEELDKLIVPLLEGLELAHASKVFHFDLNPDCIIVRDNGSPVMVDFGVFRVGLRRRLPPPASTPTAFAAPELQTAQGGPLGPWTDIYSLAGLLYLAISGKAPPAFKDRSAGMAVAKAASVAEGRYRTEFLAAIDAALQMQPEARPQDIAVWRKQLTQQASSRFGFGRSEPVALAAVAMAEGQPRKPDEGMAGNEEFPELPELPSGPGSPPPGGVPLMENRAFRAMFFGLVGIFAGAIGGGLASVLVASLLRPECGGDNCIAPFVLPLATLGALAGLVLGARFGRAPVGKGFGSDETRY